VASDTILIASATANTAAEAVRLLSAAGKYKIRALCRKPESPKAAPLKKLANVTVVKGDFTDHDSIRAALKGVKRAMLVSAAGKHDQFEWESDFVKLAVEAGIEAIVRVSTATCLIHPGTTGVYARSHASMEAFIDYHKYPVVDLNPNWFMDNILGSAAEAKATGRISWPAPGGFKIAFVDPRDVGSAAAAILSLPSDELTIFLAARKIEIHGPKLTCWDEQLAALSKAVGYEIKLNQVPGPAWVKAMMGFGMSRVFANSFCGTIQTCGGIKEPFSGVFPQKNSGILLATGWKPKHDDASWVQSPKVLAAFTKAE